MIAEIERTKQIIYWVVFLLAVLGSVVYITAFARQVIEDIEKQEGYIGYVVGLED